MVDATKNGENANKETTKDVYKAVPAKVDPLKELTFAQKLSQQKLPAYSPEVRYVPMMIVTVSISIIFIVLGAVISFEIERVLAIEKALTVSFLNDKSATYVINVTDDVIGDVIFMYKLKNFYQNHRLYYKDKQRYSNLYGIDYCPSYSDSIFVDNSIPDCGTGFNFMYQNKFVLLDKNSNPVPMTDDGIVLDVDLRYRRNSDKLTTNSDINQWKNHFEQQCLIINSSCWDKKIYELDTDFANNGVANKDFIVWQRPAAFSTFRKLYRRLVRDGSYTMGLPKGLYTLDVTINSKMSHPGVEQFFIITVPSWLGIRNKMFGVMYIVIGLLGILASVLMTLVHLKFGKKSKSVVYPVDNHQADKSL
uniref:Cell cycle control protein 50A n=1 Tax=Panagrellus redivivus TaxID=6233 RepID=A0A7E4WAT4_PANRE